MLSNIQPLGDRDFALHPILSVEKNTKRITSPSYIFSLHVGVTAGYERTITKLAGQFGPFQNTQIMNFSSLSLKQGKFSRDREGGAPVRTELEE